MRLKYNLESEIEAGGPEEEDPITDTDHDEDDRMENDFPEQREAFQPWHRHAYRDESPYCSCGKNLDA